MRPGRRVCRGRRDGGDGIAQVEKIYDDTTKTSTNSSRYIHAIHKKCVAEARRREKADLMSAETVGGKL